MTSRRDLLRKTILGLGAGVVATRSVPTLAEMCTGVTPAQVEGPFYPIAEQLDSDNDLTYVKDQNAKAKGTVIFVTGIVSDAACTPIEGALVEIWQACESGKYSHPNDPNPAPLDPQFQYFGRCVTNSKGEYLFKTIRPGSYPANNTWIRPAHIHYKVHLRGYEELTTQMYFSDDPLNEKDLIFLNTPKPERSKIVVDFTKKKMDGVPLGQFDLTLKKVLLPQT